MADGTKKILFIILLVVVSILIGFGLYWLFKPGVEPIQNTPLSLLVTSTGKLPTSGGRVTSTNGGNQTGGDNLLPSNIVPDNGGGSTLYNPAPVSKVTNDYATYPSLSQNGAMRYHNVSDGKFYKVNPDGSISTLSDQVFFNVQKVTWAKNADKAVLEYPDGTKTVYNFEKQTQYTMPQHWQDFSFSADSNQIAAKSIGLSPDNRWLITTNDDGTATKLIEPLGNNADRVTMDWSPSRQTVAFSRTGEPQGGERQEVLFIGLNGENFKSTVVEGLDFQPSWSPTGQKLLYSVDNARSNYSPELWVVDAYGDSIGSNRKLLGVATWADKCSFANDDTVYCAVPRDLPQGSGMAPEIAANSLYDMYKIDVRTGLKTPITLGGDYHIDTVSYNASTNKLYFTDKVQTGIYEVNL